MANILLIETSAEICSVAIASDGKIINSQMSNGAMQHATHLPIYIETAMKLLKEQNITLDAVAVSSGPGSYTGLRIGVSTAKGLCYALGCKLIAIDTLKIIATAFKQSEPANMIICPLVDARRMEVYTAMYDAELNQISPAEAKIIDENSFAEIDCPIYFCGSGAEKCSKVIQNPNANFDTTINPTANMMVDLAEEAYDNKQFEDVAYYEPFYLKEFYTPQKTQKTEN
jgi:tRNA threonylcarbamoyladenosine biosynthesis protein TsaB